jgi:hypothetical protein
MALVDRVKGILLNPKQEWATIETEPASVGSLFSGYAIPLAAIPAVAGLIGWSVIGVRFPLVGTIRVPMSNSLTRAAVTYVGSLVGVYVLGLIIDALAPNFGGQKNSTQAMKVAVYSMTASWVAGIFLIIPSLGILTILGIYSLYLLFLGLPQLMKSPEDKSLVYTVVVVVVGIVIYAIIATVASRLGGYGTWGTLGM